MNYDNYPDDIRLYDRDPRSPFYEEPECPECGSNDFECEGDKWEWSVKCNECGYEEFGGKL